MSKGVFGTPSGKKIRAPALLNEGPEVIGMMSIDLTGGGSLDTAIRNVAKNGPPISSGLFRDIVGKADTREDSDMKSAVSRMVSELPEGAFSYGMALHMVVSASDAKEVIERERMLKDASDLALSGLREVGKEYSASLNSPCMIIFSIGIMVPMVLMSVVPMLSISGMFGSIPIGTGEVSLVTLVMIPAAVLAIMAMIRDRNPFIDTDRKKQDFRCLLPLLVAIPLLAITFAIGLEPVKAICIALLVTGIVGFVSVYPKYNAEMQRRKRSQLLQDAVFELGNRLLTGEAFEPAFVGSVSARSQCRPVAERFKKECILCRGDVEDALRQSMDDISKDVATFFCDIYRASLRDVRDAGKLALSIGRELKDQSATRRSIRSDLKGMTDTMFSTAAVFAPLVLGLSVSMLGPLSRISEDIDMGGTATVLSIYLTELSVIIAALIAVLDGKIDTEEIMRRVSVMLPVAMGVFLVTTSFSL